jgi:hypothetical protein
MAVVRQLTAAGLVVWLLAGCTGADPSRLGEPSPAPWGPDLTDEEAFARIPLEGTEVVRLHWRLPDLDDEDPAAAAVLAARRFQSLGYYRNSQATPDADAYLYQWVATERMIRVHYPDGRPADPDSPGLGASSGVVWIWVIEVEQPWPSEVFVHMCKDIGWHGGENLELPKRAYRASLETLWVRRTVDDDGQVRWKVNGVNPNSRSELGPELGQRCTEWATHELEEER